MLAQYGPAQTNPTDIEPVEIEHMMRQSDPETKLLLLNRLWNDYQKAGMIHWAYDNICSAFEDINQPVRALAAGEKLLTWDPEDVEIARKSLKIAESQKDAALIEKWSGIASRSADRVLSSPQSGEAGKRRMEVARSLRDHMDYLAYSAITRIADVGRKREAALEFLRSHKRSTYKTAVEDLYLKSWRDSGDVQSTLAAAKRILEQDEANLTALAIVADSYVQNEREPNKLIAYAKKILAVLDKQPKQDGLTDAEWSSRKAPLIGRAYWMIGSVSIQQDRYLEADKSIRAALPYLKSNSQLLSAALFYLGWANLQLGNLSEAATFNRQCTQVKGPYQGQAVRNLQAISAQIASRN